MNVDSLQQMASKVVRALQNIDIDKINVGDLIVILALSITLFASVWFGMNELSMSIASGLLGYIGGTTKHMGSNSNETDDVVIVTKKEK